MADFKSSLAKGLQAAADAERRRHEVKSVIAELAKQVFEATDETVRIAVDQWDPLGFSGLLKNIDASKYLNGEAIFALNTKSKDKEMLAKWEQSKDGYPCKITIGNDVYSCEDRASLENCLSILLQDPIVGEKIQKLMQPKQGLL